MSQAWWRAPSNNRMKLTKPPRAAFGVACSPFGEHRGFCSLSVCWADLKEAAA